MRGNSFKKGKNRVCTVALKVQNTETSQQKQNITAKIGKSPSVFVLPSLC